MNTVVEVKNLKKIYDGREVLKDISFSAGKGEIFALLGINGAGKTTALECIEGLRKCDGGVINIKGNRGIQLQSSALPSFIKPFEALKLFSKWNKTQTDIETAKSLGIDDFYKKPYYKLSTGQKRRLHLALCLVGDPDVVFLDEPTAGLDVEGRASLHQEIRKLKSRGKTIIMASHDMSEVEALSTGIGILSKGRLIFSGTVEELEQKMDKLYSIKISTKEGEKIYQCADIGKTMYDILEDCKRRNLVVCDIKISRGTLEEHLINISRGNEV